MTTWLCPMGARCAGGRRGHSCGRGAGPRSLRRWRSPHGGSRIVGGRYSGGRSGCRAYPMSETTRLRPACFDQLGVRSSAARARLPRHLRPGCRGGHRHPHCRRCVTTADARGSASHERRAERPRTTADHVLRVESGARRASAVWTASTRAVRGAAGKPSTPPARRL